MCVDGRCSAPGAGRRLRRGGWGAARRLRRGVGGLPAASRVAWVLRGVRRTCWGEAPLGGRLRRAAARWADGSGAAARGPLVVARLGRPG